MNTLKQRFYYASLAVAVFCGVPVDRAKAAALGFTGTGGFVVDGAVNNVAGTCFPAACDTGFVAFNTGALLADGMVVSGNVREVIQEDGIGDTTSALLQVTGITATNTGLAQASDTLFLVSDVFDPSLAGAAGVGITGAYVADGAGNIAFASTQAQMNYLLAPVGGFAAPINNFALTTPATVVTCVLCGPVPFWEAAFVNPAPGGTVQLIGAINFTVNSGDSVVLPGSLIIEDDDNAAILAEAPEPGTVFLLGLALLGIGMMRKKAII
jgi:hypothetical protein